MSANTGGETGRSGLVANVVVAIEIASPSLSVQKLFPHPVCVATIMSSVDVVPCRPMSANVGSDTGRLGVIENVG
jgi:hypothetical protein